MDKLLRDIDDFLFVQFEVPGRREAYNHMYGDKLLAFEQARELRDRINREIDRAIVRKVLATEPAPQADSVAQP